jgi:predicted metal-dependent hydrolase
VALEDAMRHTFGWLGRTRSQRFNLAFAAGFETVAYASARWTEKHLRELFRGADPVPATLFLWHLAEEVEHKSVAFDVYRAVGGRRLTYAAGMITSAVLLALFSVIGTLIMLFAEHRAFSPLSHARLFKWSFGFVFDLFPTMLVSAMPRHHPSDFTDPIWLSTWLAQFDPETGTMPLYSMDFLTD